MASAHVDIKAPRTWALDIVVGVMSVVLVAFLLATMNVRREDAAVVQECHERLMALAAAQQGYLIKHGRFADDMKQLRPFLDPARRDMPLKCPITGLDLELVVQGQKYILLAPGTGFSVMTGDPNW